jgi:hypothetical protein
MGTVVVSMRRLRPRGVGALVFTVGVLAGGIAAATNAATGLASSQLPKATNCGLVQSKQWAEGAPSPITGHWYSIGAYHMPCGGSLGAKVLTNLALYHTLQSNSSARRFHFHCTVTPPLNSGYCYTGSLTRPTKATKYFAFAPESNCADPNPPYTPYETLPTICHD